MKNLLSILLLALFLASCGNRNKVSETGIVIEDTSVAVGYPKTAPTSDSKPKPVKTQKVTGGEGIAAYNALPNATIFRMNGNYSKNVAVTVSPDGDLTYFPAPMDITADSEPIALDDGWWLNCQGLGPNSVFTKYTFAYYSSLPQTPTPDQIKLEIIHGSKVTQFKELPMKLEDAVNNIQEVNAYIKNNLSK